MQEKYKLGSPAKTGKSGETKDRRHKFPSADSVNIMRNTKCETNFLQIWHLEGKLVQAKH